MRHTLAASAATLVLCGSAFATVTPGTLFGDSYIVKEGSGASARFFSVLDVYMKASTSKDIISSTFGVTAYVSSFTQNQGQAFVQSVGGVATTSGAAASTWLPTNDDGKSWDSFVTCGTRQQGSDNTLAGGKGGFLGLQLDTNWAAASTGAAIVGQNGGAGWYPSIGASTSSNPYCRVGYYNGQTGAVNTAKAATNIAGNGITAGQSLNNHWMIGRFVIEVGGLAASDARTVTMVLAVAGKNFATEASTTSTTFTGATATSGRFNYTLNFAVPAPGAAALIGLAGMMTRRRARA